MADSGLVSCQLVELKNGETYNGHLVSCDNWMNINLREVICTSRVSALCQSLRPLPGGRWMGLAGMGSGYTVTRSVHLDLKRVKALLGGVEGLTLPSTGHPTGMVPEGLGWVWRGSAKRLGPESPSALDFVPVRTL